MYDYGMEKNQQLYEDTVPPAYEMQNIKDFPIAIIGGTSDQLASILDFRALRDRLNSTDSCVFYKEYDYGHLGFLVPPTNEYFFEMLELINHFI